MAKRTILCPTCSGSGEVRKVKASRTNASGSEVTVEQCGTCSGVGAWDAED